jgi:hypothetical protein
MYTPQGGAIEGNTADDNFQGIRDFSFLDFGLLFPLAYCDWLMMERSLFGKGNNLD